MKILLVNENPVVTKLVTLSAQKTSDTLDVVSSLDALGENRYDLVVIDDGVFNEALFEELEAQVSFSRSLFICSRDTIASELFTHTLKKPFLPTDLVDIFASIGVESGDMDLESDDAIALPQDLDATTSLDEMAFDDVLDLDETLNLDEELNFDEDLNLDDDIELNDDLTLDEESTLDEELSFDDELMDDDDSFGESVLDTEEAQKVKELLEETSSEDGLLDELLFDEVEDELPLEDAQTQEAEEEPDDMFDLEEEIAAMSDVKDESIEDTEVEDDMMDESFEDEMLLGSEIEDAIEGLSDEDLESELDDDVLSALEGISTKDLKIAIGEELQGDEESFEALDEMDELDLADLEEEEVESISADTDAPEGVEALKNLLEALSDKKVAASMKGMQITINITLGVK